MKTVVIQSKEEFIKRRAQVMNMTTQQYLKVFNVKSCDCMDKYCPGWFESVLDNKEEK